MPIPLRRSASQRQPKGFHVLRSSFGRRMNKFFRPAALPSGPPSFQKSRTKLSEDGLQRLHSMQRGSLRSVRRLQKLTPKSPRPGRYGYAIAIAATGVDLDDESFGEGSLRTSRRLLNDEAIVSSISPQWPI